MNSFKAWVGRFFRAANDPGRLLEADPPIYSCDDLADVMVWTCAQYGHRKHPDYSGCVCGEPSQRIAVLFREPV